MAGELKLQEEVIARQKSWVMRSGNIELAVTRRGAHMAPVVFGRDTAKPFQPYYISPWQEEGQPMPAPVLEPLRGDFFCLPFGGNGTPWQGERHPPHGETSGSDWKLASAELTNGAATMTLALETKARPGRVAQSFTLAEGQDAVYSRVTIEGFAGPAPFGHHAILSIPDPENSVLISTSPFKFGMTCPHPFSRPENGEYQSLAQGATFSDLSQVPTLFKDPAMADCSAFPARFGYADLLGLFEEPSGAPAGAPSWVAAVNTIDHWLWFALKDPAVMPARVFWMENHGRHGHPWNGRNRCLGIEDGCMYFDAGVAESANENVLSRQGIPTCHWLKGSEPAEIRYIQGAVAVPEGFGRVAGVNFEQGNVTFTDAAGRGVKARLNYEFLRNGKI